MRIVLLVLSLLVLASCAPSEQAIQTAIAATSVAQAALETDTPTDLPSTATTTTTATATTTTTATATAKAKATTKRPPKLPQIYIETLSPAWTQRAIRNQTAWAPATWAALTPSATATQTFTPAPFATATQTFTPAPTHTPDLTKTADAEILATNAALTETAVADAALTASRGSGFYLVGVDIAPGIWRSTAGLDSCYWARYDKNQNILGNDFGQSGGAVTIRATDFQVEFDDCGTWGYISP